MTKDRMEGRNAAMQYNQSSTLLREPKKEEFALKSFMTRSAMKKYLLQE